MEDQSFQSMDSTAKIDLLSPHVSESHSYNPILPREANIHAVHASSPDLVVLEAQFTQLIARWWPEEV